MIDTELKLVLGHKPPLFDVPPGWRILTTDPDNKKDFYVEILTGYLVCKELDARGIDIQNSCGCLTIVDENKQYVLGTRQ